MKINQDMKAKLPALFIVLALFLLLFALDDWANYIFVGQQLGTLLEALISTSLTILCAWCAHMVKKL